MSRRLHAALGGATTSTSVDASSTYLKWFNENLALNGLSERQHRGVRADVRQWLSEDQRQYDLIMVDPPSFSNSSGLPDFDVQADHAELLALAMARLSANGTLYFSTNHRRFKLDDAISRALASQRCHRGFYSARFCAQPTYSRLLSADPCLSE